MLQKAIVLIKVMRKVFPKAETQLGSRNCFTVVKRLQPSIPQDCHPH